MIFKHSRILFTQNYPDIGRGKRETKRAGRVCMFAYLLISVHVCLYVFVSGREECLCTKIAKLFMGFKKFTTL